MIIPYGKVRDNPLRVKKTSWIVYMQQYPWKIKAMKRDGWKCTNCGKKPPEIKLHVHHLDKNSRHSKSFNGKENNSLDNLITLCVRCHAHEHKIEFKMNPHVGMMRELKNQGFTYQDIGNEFGISRQRVHQILNGYINKRGNKCKSLA